MLENKTEVKPTPELSIVMTEFDKATGCSSASVTVKGTGLEIKIMLASLVTNIADQMRMPREILLMELATKYVPEQKVLEGSATMTYTEDQPNPVEALLKLLSDL